jgi:hypothetical protein
MAYAAVSAIIDWSLRCEAWLGLTCTFTVRPWVSHLVSLGSVFRTAK